MAPQAGPCGAPPSVHGVACALHRCASVMQVLPECNERGVHTTPHPLCDVKYNCVCVMYHSTTDLVAEAIAWLAVMLAGRVRVACDAALVITTSDKTVCVGDKRLALPLQHINGCS